jgi:hypothetical protein
VTKPFIAANKAKESKNNWRSKKNT